MNYQLMLDETIQKLDKVPKLLLHACCAPCSSACLEYLSDYFAITVFFYNPNMDTQEEYEKRLEELQRFIEEYPAKNKIEVIDLGYLNEEYERIVKGLENEPERGKRCLKCYELRLEKSFLYAKEHNFDYITTTLTLSPYKNSKVINEIGRKLEEKYEFPYLYSDFKKKNGYKRSIELSKEYHLYRQNYCGCKYSKRDSLT